MRQGVRGLSQRNQQHLPSREKPENLVGSFLCFKEVQKNESLVTELSPQLVLSQGRVGLQPLPSQDLACNHCRQVLMSLWQKTVAKTPTQAIYRASPCARVPNEAQSF